MGFAAARRAEEDDVGTTFQPGIARDKGHDLGFGQRGGSESRPGDGFPDVRDCVELEGVERLCGWQPGLGQVTLDPASAALGDFELGQSSQQPCCGPALLVRAPGWKPDSMKMGQAWVIPGRCQIGEQQAEPGGVDGSCCGHAVVMLWSPCRSGRRSGHRSSTAGPAAPSRPAGWPYPGRSGCAVQP